MAEQPPQTKKRVVNRSPEYPAVGLEDAITRAKTLHGEEGFAYAPVAVAAGHWGYAPGSGSGLRMIAALRHFGLLEETGSGKDRRVRLTQNAKAILLDPREGSAEKQAAIRQAALSPKIYKTLWAAWGPDLPSDENMKYDLQFKYEFNPASVDGFIKDFRATVAFANLGQGGDTSQEGEGGEAEVSPPEAARKSGGAAAPTPAKETPMPEVVTQAHTRTWDFAIPLSSGAQAVLRVPLPMSLQDYALLTGLLDATLKSVKSSIVAEGTGAKPDVEESA